MPWALRCSPSTSRTSITSLGWNATCRDLFFTDIFEWTVHKYVMHRPAEHQACDVNHQRHTLNHHQFFSDEEMRFRDDKDWRVTVFPPMRWSCSH